VAGADRRPAAKPKKPARAKKGPAKLVDAGLWEFVENDMACRFGNGLREMDPLEQWDAAWEDEDGEVPARWADRDRLFKTPAPSMTELAMMTRAHYKKHGF
jgi:hypothetical protein